MGIASNVWLYLNAPMAYILIVSIREYEVVR